MFLATVYLDGKLIRKGGLGISSDFKKSSFSTDIQKQSSSNIKRTTNIFADIWCILTGGSILYGEINGCYWGGDGWISKLGRFLSDIFSYNPSPDGGGYGSNSQTPAGVWYGPSPYSGSSPGEGGGSSSTSSSEPYQGGPIWVATFVPADPDGCVVYDDFGQAPRPAGGCPSGSWQNVQLPDQDNTPIDYANMSEVDASTEGFDDSDEPTVLPDDNSDNFEYQQSDGWPVVSSVIPAKLFIKYDGEPTHCLRLAKQQIGLLGYTVSGYSTTNGRVFRPYNENSNPQVNQSQARKAVKYINNALSSGIPVLIGVDYAPGAPVQNHDNTTNHFVVIVGAGTDANGKYYRFFDSATNQPARGVSLGNKLYYNESTGLISGHTQVGSLSGLTYRVTQVRKSIK